MSEQFLDGTSAHYELFTAVKFQAVKSLIAAGNVCCCTEAVVMRGTAQQYPMMPPAHGFPVVVPPGAVPRQPVMAFPPSSAGLPPNMHPRYAFHQSMYGMPVVS